jgi:hypothetical protein
MCRKLLFCSSIVLHALLGWQGIDAMRLMKQSKTVISRDFTSAPQHAQGQCVEAIRPVLASMAVRELFDAGMNWNYSWWEFPSKDSAYQKQWAGAASKVHVFSSSKCNRSLTWGELMTDESVYSYERDRLLLLRRLAQDSWYVVNESTVHGVCDLSAHSLRWLVRSKKFLQRLWLELPNTTCLNISLQELEVEARAALEEECLDECSSTFSSMFDNCSCKEMREAHKNRTREEAYFVQALNSSTQCSELPYDTVEAIAEHMARKKCMTFHAPSVLWQIDDKSPGEITQEAFGGIGTIVGMVGARFLLDEDVGVIATNAVAGLASGIASGLGKSQGQELPVTAVCTIPPQYNTSGSKEHIVQKGSCPEGMKCKCPMTRLRERQKASEIRKEGSVFFNEGVASLPSFVSQARFHAQRVLIQGTLSVGFQAALMNALTVPSFLLIAGFQLTGQALWAWATFQCQTTVGCWPQEPDRVSVDGTRDACRMPPKAEEGGSPVWFLPPPGLRIKHSKTFCVLDKCKKEHWREQKVGIGLSPNDWREGKPDVYNCQPLSFQVMDRNQREEFIRKLEDSGIEAEYNLTDAREYIAAHA